MNTKILEIIYENETEIKVFYDFSFYVKYNLCNYINTFWVKQIFNDNDAKFKNLSEDESILIENEYQKTKLMNERFTKFTRLKNIMENNE